MSTKNTGLHALLALGLALSPVFAQAQSLEISAEAPAVSEVDAFTDTFLTTASYMTESSEGYVRVEMPAELAATLDQAVYVDLLASIEQHNAELTHSGASAPQDSLRIPFAKKLIIIGLKHGGPVLKKIVSKVSPKAGKWLGKNVGKLTNFLEALDNWAELPIITFLVKNGVPPADAKMMAEIIVALL
jgi:hypothetical protein